MLTGTHNGPHAHAFLLTMGTFPDISFCDKIQCQKLLFFLLQGVKVGSKTNIPGSKISCHLTAFLTSTLVHIFVRCKTKQNSIWSNAFTMPLTIWKCV